MCGRSSRCQFGGFLMKIGVRSPTWGASCSLLRPEILELPELSCSNEPVTILRWRACCANTLGIHSTTTTSLPGWTDVCTPPEGLAKDSERDSGLCPPWKRSRHGVLPGRNIAPRSSTCPRRPRGLGGTNSDVFCCYSAPERHFPRRCYHAAGAPPTHRSRRHRARVLDGGGCRGVGSCPVQGRSEFVLQRKPEF